MSNQFTRKTITRLRRSELLGDVIDSNIEALQPALAERVSPEYAATLVAMQEGTVAELDRQKAMVREAARELTAEMQDDDPVREARDEAVDELRSLTVQVRPSIESAFGQKKLTTYGLQGKTPRVPVELSEFVGNAIHLMRKEPAEATNPLGVTVKTEAVVGVIEPALERLDDVLAAVEAERQELITAYNKRDRALASFDDVYELAAALADRVYRLAGRDDLADQLATRLRNVDASGGGSDADPVEPVVDVDVDVDVDEPVEA